MKKNFIKTSLFLLVVIGIIYSCSKDQAAVKTLSGYWAVESVTYTGKKPDEILGPKGFFLEYPNCYMPYEEIVKIQFYECKLKTSGSCDEWNNPNGMYGPPSGCSGATDNWCNLWIIYSDTLMGTGKSNCFSWINNTPNQGFKYRIVNKGKKLVTGYHESYMAFDILSLDKNKAVFEYKSDTLNYTVTLKKM